MKVVEDVEMVNVSSDVEEEPSIPMTCSLSSKVIDQDS